MITNGSPLPLFETDDNNSFFHATIRIHEAFVDEDIYIACNQLATSISEGVKELIIRLNTQTLSKADIQLATTLATKSRQYFDKAVFMCLRHCKRNIFRKIFANLEKKQ